MTEPLNPGDILIYQIELGHNIRRALVALEQSDGTVLSDNLTHSVETEYQKDPSGYGDLFDSTYLIYELAKRELDLTDLATFPNVNGISPDSVGYELFRMNSPEIWQPYISLSPANEHIVKAKTLFKEIFQRGFHRIVATEEEQFMKQFVTMTASYNNRTFFGGTSLLIGLGLLYGEQFETVLSNHGVNIPNVTTHMTGYLQARIIGAFYEIPAQNASDLYKRLKVLFRSPDTYLDDWQSNESRQIFPPIVDNMKGRISGRYFNGELPGIKDFFADANPFGIVIPNPEQLRGVPSSCPAQDTTFILYDAYGKVLSKSNYQHKFITAVTRPSAPSITITEENLFTQLGLSPQTD